MLLRILGVGVDIVRVGRMDEKVQQSGSHFLDECFTAAEQRACTRADAFDMQRLAARFAAKEATAKALGTGFIGEMQFTDVEVQADPNGKPRLCLSGETAAVAEARGIVELHVSLSHSGNLAIAFVIAIGR